MSKVYILRTEQVNALEQKSRNEVVDWLYEAVKLNPGIPSETLVLAVNEWLGNPHRDIEGVEYAAADMAGVGEYEYQPLDEDADGEVLNPADVAAEEQATVEAYDDASLDAVENGEEGPLTADEIENLPLEPEDLELDDEVDVVEVQEEVEPEGEAVLDETEALEVVPVEDEPAEEEILVAVDDDYNVAVNVPDEDADLEAASEEVRRENVSEAAQQRLNLRSILRDASALDRSSSKR